MYNISDLIIKIQDASFNKEVYIKNKPDFIANKINSSEQDNELKEEFYDIAFIPDLKTSILMNKLFRNIKENQNLDALEESDDEAEFENEREDKVVFLDRSFKMNCQYNYKFKKWVPLSLAARDSRVISSNKL